MPVLIRGGGAPDKSKGLTATAADIAWGKTALVDGQVVVGKKPTSFAEATWAEINAVAREGFAPQGWKIGDTKDIRLSTGEVITVRIEAFNHDDLTSGGKAPLTLGMVSGLKEVRKMNATDTNAGGWGSTAMRAWMTDTLFGQLPSDLQAIIKQANKKTSAGSKSSSIITTADKLWLFSYTEVGFTNNPSYSPGNSSEGAAYPLFTSDASRTKHAGDSFRVWWLRSPYLAYDTSFCRIEQFGSPSTGYGTYDGRVVTGFCI